MALVRGMNWQAFLEPELWKIIARMGWTICGLSLNVLFMAWLVLGFWHGWSFDIGKEGAGFHMHLEQYPLKRFFQ